VHLDPALIRPGRIDYVMHFDYANKEEMRRMFNRFYDLNENDKEKFKEFWEKYRKNVNVRTTTSLLQQYFFKYWDNMEGAIENTDELEEMSNACNQEVKKGMYS
jgi:SpoVK/Ycf46/Vps4 family AAA+-type ATPase